MRVTHDDLWFCTDCHFAASGVDDTIVDQGQAKAVEDGQTRLAKLGHLVPDHNSETSDGIYEFSRRKCDCCGSTLGGERHRYAILGPDAEPELSDAEFARSKAGWGFAPGGGLVPRK